MIFGALRRNNPQAMLEEQKLYLVPYYIMWCINQDEKKPSNYPMFLRTPAKRTFIKYWTVAMVGLVALDGYGIYCLLTVLVVLLDVYVSCRDTERKSKNKVMFK